MKESIDKAFFELVSVRRYKDSEWREITDAVLVEVPVSIIYNDIPHVVVMCTPQNIIDFIYGFSFTEGIVNRIEDIRSVDLVSRELGIEARVEVTAMCAARIEGRKRQMSARTGCGICGLDSLSDVVREQIPVEYSFSLDESAINTALQTANEVQLMNQKTGGAHAAFFVSQKGEIVLTREDVGRHVALDKLIGSMLREDIDPRSGFILTTSRASFEMVQKAVAARVGLLVTMSAPTSMAISLAKKMNLQLVAFARIGKINLY